MAVTTANPRDLLPTTIDMSTLSHSELQSLSLLSNSPHSSPLDAVVAQINTSSFFNESVYLTTPHQPHHHRHRHVAGGGTLSERERSESVSIVNFFKRYLQSDVGDPPERNTAVVDATVSVEIVNKNGVVVDLAALEESEEKENGRRRRRSGGGGVGGGGGGPFAEELRRLAGGREREEELLVVLAGMEGNWCSARKKRRIVAACLLGDALPVGWKVIIALRRKGGRFSPYCRTYISPTGEHFSSCKEVSSYLQSYMGINDTALLRDSRGELQQLQRVDLDNDSRRVNSKDDTLMLDVSASTTNTSLPVEQDRGVSVLGTDNLPDVNVCDLYECHTCKISFDVKDNYLQHVLSTHGRTTKRYKLDSSVADQVLVRNGHYECHTCNLSFDVKDKYMEHLVSVHKKKTKKHRLGSSVGDGVIIRDGKYECQFCHKVFEERRRYLGHVGNHVKGSIKADKDLGLQVSGTANTPCLDRSATKIDNSNMNALIEIPQGSTQEISPSVSEKEPSCMKSIHELYMKLNGRHRNADFDDGKNSSDRLDELGVEKHVGKGHYFSLQLKPCSKLTAQRGPRETGKDDGKDNAQLEESLPPFSKPSEIPVNVGDIDDSVPCLDEHAMEKDSAAKGNISSKVVYSCYKRRPKRLTTNGPISGSASCPNGLDMERNVREGKTSSLKSETHAEVGVASTGNRETKEQAFTCDMMDVDNNSRFDATMMPEVKTVKSTSTEDEGSADESEEGFDISFISYDQKPSDMDSAGEYNQSKYMDKQEPELAQKLDANNLATAPCDAGIFDPTMSQTLFNPSSPYDEIFEKAGQNICSLDPNLENGSGFEYMKLDVIEPQMYKYDAMSGEDSIFLREVSMDMEKDSGFDLGFNPPADSQSEFPGPIASTTTMICVWCGLEFSHEVVEVESQPDSVGFMCPACRAKISKQFNDLESNFSVNPRYP